MPKIKKQKSTWYLFINDNRSKLIIGFIILGLGLFIGLMLFKPYVKNYNSVTSEMANAPSRGGFIANDNLGIKDFDSNINSNLQIIKQADLTLVVKQTNEAITETQNIARNYGGYVGEVNIYETNQREKIGQVVLRVPTDSFDQVVTIIKNLAVKVEQENIKADDVTEEYLDLNARLKNYQAVETEYRDLLDLAETVEEVILVQKELTLVREQIERLESRLDYLTKRVDLATINISFKSEADVKLFGLVWNPIQELKYGFNSLLANLIDFVNLMIRFVFWLPLGIIYLMVIGLIIKISLKIFKLIKTSNKIKK